MSAYCITFEGRRLRRQDRLRREITVAAARQCWTPICRMLRMSCEFSSQRFEARHEATSHATEFRCAQMACGAANWEDIDGRSRRRFLRCWSAALRRSCPPWAGRRRRLRPASRPFRHDRPRRLTIRRRRSVSRSAVSSSGIRFFQARRTSPAQPAITPRWDTPMAWTFRSAPTASGLGRERAFLPERPAAHGQAQQSDRAERRFQRPDVRWRCQRHGRANVLGSQGPHARGAGARANQGARRNARRHLSRRPRAPGRRRSTERQPGVPPHVCSRVRRKHSPSTTATSGGRWRPFSARSSPPTRRSIATCAVTPPR